MDKNAHIFQPIRIGAHMLKNRIEVAPHGSSLYERDGSIGAKVMAFRRNQARSGAALITLGSGNINPEGRAVPLPHPADPLLIGNYLGFTEMVHEYDCKISMQLYPTKEMLMPSDEVVNNATRGDIRDLIDQYVNAASNCKRAGFDFIMIHGGHGNGPAMFFSPLFNHRTDGYGGSLENRARFAMEMLDAVRAKCGPELGIEYRLSADEISPGGATLEETIEFAKLIQDRIDLLHVSRGLLEEEAHLPYIFTPTYFPRAINLAYARRFKENLHIPVNVIGGFDLELAEKAIAEGHVDMVSMSRAFLADSLCVRKARMGKDDEIRPCVRCNTCIAAGHGLLSDIRCAVNPVCGRETQLRDFPIPRKSKKVVMIGGGPANLEAARTAAERGHRVVLFEKEAELGGNLRYASAPHFKADMRKYLDWSIRMAEREPNVDIRLSCGASRDMVIAEQPDAVFIAVGASPIIPHFSDTGTERIVWAGDVLCRNAETGKNVVIAGCGFTGLETALLLAGQGKKVTVVDMLPREKIGADAPVMSMAGLKELLASGGVQFFNEVKVTDIRDGVAYLEDIHSGSVRQLAADTVVLSLGMRRNAAAAEEFLDIAPETYVIGDCSNMGGNLWKAVHSGFDMAMEL
ncbi:MAG: FAD-dependent oxidoreductase [Mailhella sp.]|nr:FAD-dependent oxidoreductase [Mailhella sp.]